jgi:lycopene beta-cyclase
MTAAAPHLILAGGGLANGLIALRMRKAHPYVPITVIEAGEAAGGNHTWSFHQGDLSAEQHRFVEPLVRHRWPAQEVRFPAYARRLNAGYLSIPSSALAERIAETDGIELRTGIQATTVGRRHVETDTGERIEGSAVIDGRGPDRSDGLLLGFQKFLGLEVRTRQPHGVQRPVIMDATVSQADGYRFVYVLPFSADTLLIEDTRYSDGHALSQAELTEAIEDYAEAHGWEIAETLREENGVLPILMAGDFERFWPDHRLFTAPSAVAGRRHRRPLAPGRQ